MEKTKSKRGLAFYLRIYLKITSQDIKSKMSYRADFITTFFGMIALNLTGFVAFWIIFKNFPEINGWDYREMLFLYAFSLIALVPVEFFFDNNWNLQQYIVTGDFIKYCFKPLNIFFYYFSEVFGTRGLGQFVFGVGTLIYAWVSLGIPVTFLIIVKLLIALFSASLFMIALRNLSAASCFWIVNGLHIMNITNKFRDYARYPITIFGGVFRVIFTFIIPIAFMAYYPSLEFLETKQPVFLTYFTPIYGIIFFFISYKVWMKGAKSYSGTGS
jgi:ABC-2 type transport system permease protein